VLSNEYISPFFRSIADSNEDVCNIASVGDVMKIFDLSFQELAAEPSPPDMGIVDTNTMVYVELNDHLKPYLSKNKHMVFGVNDQFTHQGVQFEVVCCGPQGPARIGRISTTYCEGTLHPSLRNLLPSELLEQLSHLPPGLQMLLLNTEALAGGHEERVMEVQEMLIAGAPGAVLPPTAGLTDAVAEHGGALWRARGALDGGAGDAQPPRGHAQRGHRADRNVQVAGAGAGRRRADAVHGVFVSLRGERRGAPPPMQPRLPKQNPRSSGSAGAWIATDLAKSENAQIDYC